MSSVKDKEQPSRDEYGAYHTLISWWHNTKADTFVVPDAFYKELEDYLNDKK